MEKKKFRLPKIGARVIKTLVAVLVAALAYEYLLDGRNAASVCIGAVYGVGNVMKDGAKSGFNRVFGAMLGGLVAIPFYYLFSTTPFGIPSSIYLVLGLFLTIYINIILNATSAIQPGTIVYFVVLFTQTPDTYVGYTVARVVDTAIGVLIGLVINVIYQNKVHNGDDVIKVDDIGQEI